MIDPLIELLREFDKIDLAPLGQQIGQVAALMIEAFRGGQVGDILYLSIKIAFLNALNYWFDIWLSSWKAFGSFLGQLFVQVGQNFLMVFDILKDGTFWAGMKDGMVSAAKGFISALLIGVATMLDLLSNAPGLGFLAEKSDRATEKAAKYDFESKQSGKKSGDELGDAVGERLKKRLDHALGDLSVSITSQFGKNGKPLVDTKKDQAALDAQWKQAGDRLNKKDIKGKTHEKGDGEPGEGIGVAVVADSLQSVGGGGRAAGALFGAAMEGETADIEGMNDKPVDPATATVEELTKHTDLLQQLVNLMGPVKGGGSVFQLSKA